MHINLSHKSSAFYFSLVFLLLSYLDSLLPGTRYIKYILPVGLLLIWISSSQVSGNIKLIHKQKTVQAFLVLIYLSIFSLLFRFNTEGVKDLIFIFVYLLPFILFGNFRSEYFMRVSFYSLSLLYLLKIVVLGGDSFSLVNSTGVFESTECFVFGIFFLYFVAMKKYYHAIFCVILVFLSLKRIVLIGMVLGYLLIFLDSYFKYLHIRLIQIIFMISSCFILAITYYFSLGYFDEFIFNYFGVSSNYLSMGRFHIYQFVIETASSNLSFGSGIGSTYALVDEATLGFDKNLHNDLLKIFIEGGVYLFLIFIYFLSKSLTKKNSPFYIYLLCIFSTDNILVYPQVMFFWILVVVQLNEASKIKKSK